MAAVFGAQFGAKFGARIGANNYWSTPFLRARSAADVQSLLGATPSALFQYEDGATSTVDLVGGSITLTATGGADRIASSIVGNAARIANNSTQYWGSSGDSDLDVTTNAFALVGVMTLPTAPAADSWALLKYLNTSNGYGIFISTLGHLSFYTFEAAARSVTIASSHIGATAFGFIVGRSVTNTSLYATTTIGTATTAGIAVNSISALARVAAPGRHQVDGGAGNCVGTLLDGFAFFTGAEAETILANRANLVSLLTVT
jgi:hypothetical protein